MMLIVKSNSVHLSKKQSILVVKTLSSRVHRFELWSPVSSCVSLDTFLHSGEFYSFTHQMEIVIESTSSSCCED